MIYISKVELENIRCFEELTLEFSENGGLTYWTTLSGDNATGKTTLLKAIALGLCDESSAAGLLRESEGGYLTRHPRSRSNCDSGKIRIFLQSTGKGKREYFIENKITRIHKYESKTNENLRQRTSPKYFPWHRIFVCAYGIGRGTSGAGDLSGYSSISAVYNLFNYTEGLQNPELIIRRKGEQFFKKNIVPMLCRILKFPVDSGSDRIFLSELGIEVRGDWGRYIHLRDLADGYRSTFQWVLDYIGWCVSFHARQKIGINTRGIVLVDSIEEHLHPKWQKTIVADLRETFPKTQFITTTHSPLIAASVGTLENMRQDEKLVHLELVGSKVVISEHTESVRGLSYDQILASKHFDYIFEEGDPRINKVLRKASQLATKGKERTKKEDIQYKEITNVLSRILVPYESTIIERDVRTQRWRMLKASVRELEQLLKE